ncbi:MAG TPA: peptide ligase PGM1-related protein [Nocardioidaceae bacterium]|nr:peptide ligase PGM1-related protein [Nocardioidaceae bacterium]
MDEFALLQQRLPEAWAANATGSTTPHVVIALPSFSLGETIMSHYAPRIPALEHRYLLSCLMLPRIPGCDLIFVSCASPAPEVLDYYAGLWPREARSSASGRLHIVEVPDRSGRSVAIKLLEHPELIEQIRRLIGGRPAMIEPWNVTELEVALAEELGVPINGTAPTLWPLGFKSAGRRLFQRAGVPVALGREDIHDLADVASAIAHIRTVHPNATGVVVKHDNSGAGDGNLVIRLTDDQNGTAVRDQLAGIPAWYVSDLTAGGIVEELVTGEGFSSPSVQLDISPFGDVTVLSTHEQVLGGPDDQVYLGCTFPADESYAAELAEHGRAVGTELAKHGVLGRVGVDFVAVRNRGSWEVFALEINLRKGGTTHPFSTLRHLTPGMYDETSGHWRTDGNAGTRYYRSTDNLVDETRIGWPARRVIDIVRVAGLNFDPATGTGVVLHMLECLAIDGRLGLTAIGRSRAEADDLYDAVDAALTASVARS